MITLSATCLALALADQRGTLRLEEREGRFGTFVTLCDDRGLIEVADDLASADARIRAIRERVA